jgi:hypothetical protein
MPTSQHQHIATAMQVANDGANAQAAARHEQVIRDGWPRNDSILRQSATPRFLGVQPDDLLMPACEGRVPGRHRRERLALPIQRLLGSGHALTPAAFQRLLDRAWPGNLSELRNGLEGAARNRSAGPIDVDALPEWHLGHLPTRTAACDAAAEAQAPHALRSALWNVSAVARQMGLARMTLYRRMKRAGIVSTKGQRPQ